MKEIYKITGYKKLKMFLLTVISILLIYTISGCGVKESKDQENGGQESDASALQKQIENYFNISEYELSDLNGIYDISALIPEVAGMRLANYGFREDDMVLLVYKTKWEDDNSFIGDDAGTDGSTEEDNMTDSSEENMDNDENNTAQYDDIIPEEERDEDTYISKSLNIKTGEVIDMPWSFKVLHDEYNSSKWLSLVSCNPLVLYDYSTGTIYTPEYEKQSISLESDSISDIYCINGKLYVVRTEGIIDRVNEDYTLEEVYAAPNYLGGVYTEKRERENVIRLSTTAYGGDNVYIDVNTDTWETEIYTQDYYEYFFSDVKGETVCGADYDYEGISGEEAKGIYTIDMQKGLKKSISFPEHFHDESYIDISPGSMSSDKLLFGIFDYNGNVTNLFFWNMNICDESGFAIHDKTPYVAEEIDYDEMSDKADEIGKRYGVEIKFGDNIKKEISDYTFETCDSMFHISNALDVIDDTLAYYPKGFFDELESDYKRDTVIYLTGNHIPKDSSVSISNAAGLSSEEDGLFMMFLNIEDGILTAGTIIHEAAHIIDDKLYYDGVLDDDKWCELNPDGFDYYYEYVNADGVGYSETDDYEYTSNDWNAWDNDYKDTYFIDVYSKTWPTEDRARLMEYLIGDMSYEDNIFHSSHIKEKLDYYFKLIREDLGCADWPEKTTWERRLDYYR